MVQTSNIVAHNRESARKWEPHHPELGPVDSWNWEEVEGIIDRLRERFDLVAVD